MILVYYSYEGNTEELVSGMKQVIKADVLKLEVENEKKTKSLFRFVWGGKEVYMTKKPKLKKYDIDLDKYDNIIIGSPCWFGSYAPAINTFLSENVIQNKNIYLLVCDGGNFRNTWKNYEEVLKGNNIVSRLDIVYPVKKGINKSIEKCNKWILSNIKK